MRFFVALAALRLHEQQHHVWTFGADLLLHGNNKLLDLGCGEIIAKFQAERCNHLIGCKLDCNEPVRTDNAFRASGDLEYLVLERPIGVGQLVPGFDKALVGQPVGSRVLMVLPPSEGYGKQGNSAAGIKGTDTLVFVVDLLDAY